MVKVVLESDDGALLVVVASGWRGLHVGEGRREEDGDRDGDKK